MSNIFDAQIDAQLGGGQKPFPSGLVTVAADKSKELMADGWVSLRSLHDPESGLEAYTYSNETRCRGHIVAVLPTRVTATGEIEYLLRDELCPPWGMSQSVTCITGGCEEGDTPVGDAVRELEEEAGYKIPASALVSLGECRGTKSSDSVYHLFTVDLSSYKAGEILGDGTENERRSANRWSKTIWEAVDPLVSTMFVRMHRI